MMALNRYSQPAVVGARLFNTASDVAVTLVLDRNSSLLQWRLDSSTATVASGTVAMPGLPSDTTRAYLSVVAGDFTGDGFDEIVVFLKGVVCLRHRGHGRRCARSQPRLEIRPGTRPQWRGSFLTTQNHQGCRC